MAEKIKKSKYTYEQLYDHCLETVEFECSKCSEHKIVYQADGFSASEDLFNEGWRATANNCYCPDCANKHLKL